MEETLAESLASALPANTQLTFHHISTPPTKCDALFSAPSHSQPERTFRESHLLLASINIQSRDREVNPQQDRVVPTIAIEIIIYTTKRLTTLFVSKADSTGYLSLLDLPAGSASPARSICTTFISYLVRNRRRPHTRLVVSLFARAQDQYLFPGSVDNGTKHALDDRSLVKWWCKVLDPVIRNSDKAGEDDTAITDNSKPVENQSADGTSILGPAMGYLIVPGFDKYEITAFFPPSWKADPPSRRRWRSGHPLFELADSSDVPPRCLIPHFPDDPKARFLDELDQELPTLSGKGSHGSSTEKKPDRWKSVNSLDQFWEMMAFRQECSSGRLVGFIWAVFPVAESESCDAASRMKHGFSKTDAEVEEHHSSTQSSSCQAEDGSPRPLNGRRRKKLKGPIVTRQPRIKSSSSSSSSSSNTPFSMNYETKRPEQTEYYFWPAGSRGDIILAEKDYTRATEILLRLDFSSLELALSSFARWTREISVLARSPWGYKVTGKKALNASIHPNALSKHPRTLTSHENLKRKPNSQDSSQHHAVNVLNSGLVKKKKKVAPTLVQQQQR